MAVTVRIPQAIEGSASQEFALAVAPENLGDLITELDERLPGIRAKLDSSSVNAAVNGEVVLHGRNATKLRDGDEVEFLVMFAGG